MPKKLDPDVWWPHLQATKSPAGKRNGERNRSGVRERGLSLIGPFCSDVEKLILIKAKIKDCHSISALCNEIRNAADELDEYSHSNGPSNMKKSKSIDCVDLVQIRRVFDGIPADGGDKENCDIIESIRTKSEGTQTNEPMEVANANGMPAIIVETKPAPPPPPMPTMPTQLPIGHCAAPPAPPPPPPPMPNAVRSCPAPPPPPMPQHQTAPGNCPPPPPPPMPTTKPNNGSTVLSSSSSGFCPPPPPPMANGSPAPLPMPADGNAWFELNSE